MRALSAFALVLVTACAARAADPSPWSLHHQSLTTGRLNPLGLITRYMLELRHRLHASEAPALAENFVGLSLHPVLTPASARIGAELAVQPLTILRLAARYELSSFFGYLDQLQSFPTASADYSDSALDEREDAAYSTTGRHLVLTALVRARVGDFAVRDTFQAVHSTLDLAAGDRFFLDSVLDVLVPRRGWVASNDADLLWFADAHWTVGIRHTYTWTEARPSSNQRLGPLLAYTFGHAAPSAFERPTLILLTGWYLEHPFRTGQDVSGVMPCVVLGFSFQGRLL